MTGRGEPTLLWHTFPLGLLGADQGGADRTCRSSLRDVIEWLPHLASLGADGLLLGPVFASLSHGYDTVSTERSTTVSAPSRISTHFSPPPHRTASAWCWTAPSRTRPERSGA